MTLHRRFPTAAPFLPALLFGLAISLALPAGPAAAQVGEPVPVPLAVAETHEDSLGADELDVYTLDLEADRFVFGEADQRTLDVVVTVYDPAGEVVRRFDGPARGPELFQFDTDAAGQYRIEVAPFEGEAGRYAVVVRRAEPVATDPAERVDQLMAAFDGDRPGGVVGVVRDGELVFAEAYGLANLVHDVPFREDTPSNLGSTSKQFTAFAIALLAERGELSLDDDIRTHIPELPDLGETVTLRNLLTHTSGYREFLNTLALAGRRFDRGDHIEREELIDVIRNQPELQNPPGGEWNYNNTGFGLLTMVVERVTDTPFPEWMRKNVFEPLGMHDTVVRADPAQIIPGSSQGYTPADEGGWREASDLGGAMGAGAIYSTAADLAKWIANFESGTVGGPELFDVMTTRYVLADGDTTDYALGLFVDEYRGLRRVHHGGADVAHRAMLRYYPEIDAGVVTLSNSATFNSGAMADDVADAFFGERMESEEGDAGGVGDAGEAFDPEDFDPARFDGLAGRYALEEMPAFELRFWREDDAYYTQATGQPQTVIVPTSDSTFELTGIDATLTFHRGPDGTADSLTLHQNGDHPAHRVGEGGWEPTAAELQAFAGRYFSEELGTFYTLTVGEPEGDDDAPHLLLDHHRFAEPVTLTPGAEPDAFTGGFPVAEAEFERGEDGGVTALLVSNGRTLDVRFVKLDGPLGPGS